MEKTITFEDFQKVDLRVGTILEAREFEKARVPAYQLAVVVDDVTLPSVSKVRSTTRVTLPASS